MYAQRTGDIVVTARPVFLEDQSSPKDHRFVWAYQIRIENQGRRVVQLLTRHWRITDAQGRVQEVRGEGVVGEQPILQPGEVFEYTSGCPLNTPSGFMVGSYGMVDADGGQFDVAIPAFSLDSPHATLSVN